jgi:hypothetical protein
MTSYISLYSQSFFMLMVKEKVKGSCLSHYIIIYQKDSDLFSYFAL